MLKKGSLEDYSPILSTLDDTLTSLKEDYNYDLKEDVVIISYLREDVAKINEFVQPYFNDGKGVGTLVGLKKVLNTPSREVEYKFIPGDRVMHLVNDYENFFFNGDVGKIVAVSNMKKRMLTIQLDRNQTVGEVHIDSLTPGYAITGHKSQGSEYKVVIVVVRTPFHQTDNWLYTAITRAKERVILIGYRSSIESAITNLESDRVTYLEEIIREKFAVKTPT